MTSIGHGKTARQVNENGRQLVIPDVTGMTCKQAAHAYLDAGFWPIPWRAYKGKKMPCYSKGWTYSTIARETHERIDRWRAGWRVGLITHPRSGILAADIDYPQKFSEWVPDPPETASSSTGRDGGYHLVYDGRELGEWPKQGDIPGGQIKTNGFIAAAPSLHPSKRRYRWSENRVLEPAGDFGKMLAEHRKPRSDGTSPAQAEVEQAELWQAVLEAEDGHQRGSMFRWAVDAHARGLADDEMVSLLWLAVSEGKIQSYRPGDKWTSDGVRFATIPAEWEGAVEARLGDKELDMLYDIRNLIQVKGRLRLGPDPDEVNKWFRRKLAQNAADARISGQDRIPVPDGDSLETFLDEEDTEPDYRIEKLATANCNVITVAPDKAGKTTLRNNLIRSLADGDDFLEFYTVTPLPEGARIGVIDLELDQKMSRRWLRKHGIENQDRVSVWHLKGRASAFQIMEPESRKEWAARFRQCNVKFAMLDCLGPALEANSLTESNEDMGSFLMAWEEMLREAECPESWISHHMGHTAERGRGGSRERGWPLRNGS